MKGHKQTEETKEKIRLARLGKKHTEEEKKAISEGMKRKWYFRKLKAPVPEFEREYTFIG